MAVGRGGDEAADERVVRLHARGHRAQIGGADAVEAARSGEGLEVRGASI